MASNGWMLSTTGFPRYSKVKGLESAPSKPEEKTTLNGIFSFLEVPFGNCGVSATTSMSFLKNLDVIIELFHKFVSFVFSNVHVLPYCDVVIKSMPESCTLIVSLSFFRWLPSRVTSVPPASGPYCGDTSLIKGVVSTTVNNVVRAWFARVVIALKQVMQASERCRFYLSRSFPQCNTSSPRSDRCIGTSRRRCQYMCHDSGMVCGSNQPLTSPTLKYLVVLWNTVSYILKKQQHRR